jgi:murein hydrolase activator
MTQMAQRSAWSRRLLAATLAVPLGGALAQEPTLRPSVSDPASAPDALRLRDLELQATRAEQKRAAEAEARLRAEIAALGEDRRKLNEQLIETATRLRGAEARVAETESRLGPLAETEGAIRKSLEGRKAVIAEVLAALQRIGRRPPPAIVVRPEDALESVRSAIMLGAVLPEMRAETEALAGELADLSRIRKDIAAERELLARDAASLSDERQRMSLLVDERQKQQAESEKALEAERQKATGLARQVDNLRDLIAKLEQGLDSATRAARQAARLEEGRTGDGKPNLAALTDPGRLAPAIAFGTAKGLLPLPVNGVRLRSFGAPDPIGGMERGLSIATRSGAQVTAPCDAWVVYAGPFRSYGQLLILNAGGGYHVLLAGMERISVNPGQFVLTGEPVAVMGGGSQVAAILAAGSSQPVLYVEFRKDGTPVDPSPWWAASESEKVRG